MARHCRRGGRQLLQPVAERAVAFRQSVAIGAGGEKGQLAARDGEGEAGADAGMLAVGGQAAEQAADVGDGVHQAQGLLADAAAQRRVLVRGAQIGQAGEDVQHQLVADVAGIEQGDGRLLDDLDAPGQDRRAHHRIARHRAVRREGRTRGLQRLPLLADLAVAREVRAGLALRRALALLHDEVHRRDRLIQRAHGAQAGQAEVLRR